MALFIAPPEVSVKGIITLKGDGRSFDSASNPSHSRGYIWINADTGAYEAHMAQTGYRIRLLYTGPIGSPPTWVTFDALTGPSAYNRWEVIKVRDHIVVRYDLLLAGVLEQTAPHINGTIIFYKDECGDYRAYGERDGFPWAEAYLHNSTTKAVQTIFQRPAVRGDPEDLNAIEGSYPFGDVGVYGGKYGYALRQAWLSDKHPRKDVFGVLTGTGGLR